MIRGLLLAALLVAAAAVPADARKAAPMPKGVALLTEGDTDKLPASSTLLVAVQSFGEATEYKLAVSAFPQAKSLPKLPKAAPPAGALEEVAEPDWRKELEAARQAGVPAAGGAPVGKPKPAPKVGAKETFYVTQRKGAKDGDVAVTLKLATEHANWWVDDALKADPQLLARAAATFEAKSYKRVRKIFGKEVKQGDSGDTRLNFVITALAGVGGYFSPMNLWPTAKPRAGGGRKVLVISAGWLKEQGLDGIIAHEFQHLVNFSRKCVANDYKVWEASWVDEGFGELAVDVAGRGSKAADTGMLWRAGTWLADTAALPLEVAIPEARDRNMAYGRSYLFARYLADRFGEGIVADVMETRDVGREGIAAALAKRGEKFDGVWRDWAIALAAGAGVKVADPRFAYTSIDFAKARLVPVDAAKPEASGKLGPYTVRYHRFRAAKAQPWTVTLTGRGGGKVRAVALVVPGR